MLKFVKQKGRRKKGGKGKEKKRERKGKKQQRNLKENLPSWQSREHKSRCGRWKVRKESKMELGTAAAKATKSSLGRATNFRDALGIAFRRLERSRCSQRFFETAKQTRRLSSVPYFFWISTTQQVSIDQMAKRSMYIL